jgi:hypothetical protein
MEVSVMGRFARSNNLSRVKARFGEPRASVNFWARKRTPHLAQPRKRLKLEQGVFKLTIIVLLIIVGACSGWMMGQLLLGSPQNNAVQPATVGESSTVGERADSIPSKVAQVGTDETAGDQVEAHEGELSPNQSQRVTGARRYSKGRSFEPTSIVTKPVKAVSKPIKKLNPLKLFR